MKIQPITNSMSCKFQKKPRTKDMNRMEELEKLGARVAVSGGLIPPANAKPETIAKFKELISKRPNGELKPVETRLSSLLKNLIVI